MAVTISRQTFVDQLRYGVDLKSAALERGLAGGPVSREQLKALDANGDGRLAGLELRRLFALVDSFDQDGSPSSFRAAGEAGKVFAALRAGRRSGPYHGIGIAKVALGLVAGSGSEYALGAAPTSANSALSGNARPLRTKLAWLRGQNKCNHFVGEVLHRAGMRTPTYRMPGGGRHYVDAESLPKHRRHFDRLGRRGELRAGDLLVIDLPGRGANTAHAEVITKVDWRRRTIMATGAHASGAYETRASLLFGKDWHTLLARASYDGKKGCWKVGDAELYLLRPRLKARR